MLFPNDNVLIGVSGGADSVFLALALIHIKKRLNISLGVAHINHGIRGNEADKDQIFVENFCKNHSVPYFTTNLNIPLIAKQNKLSEETAGRHERYKFFEQICQKHGYNKIAVAHNMNDSVETMIFNIVRGSGLKGMCGIQPVNDKIIRPIIEISRSEIENYLSKNNISYCTDTTNFCDIYTRNKIRNKIIPLMQEINPTVIQTIYSNLQNINDDNSFIDDFADSTDCISVADNNVIIDKKVFNKLKLPIKKRIIFKAFALINSNCNNIESKHIDILTKEISTGKILNMPNNITVESCRNELVFSYAKPPRNITFSFKVDLNESIIKNEYFSCKFEIIDPVSCYDENCLYVDAEKLLKKRLVIRNRKDGDRIKPYGMTGTKKLKQLMSELEIKASSRSLVPLLCADEEIVAVIPYRISDDYKINDNTKSILKIQMIKE